MLESEIQGCRHAVILILLVHLSAAFLATKIRREPQIFRGLLSLWR